MSIEQVKKICNEFLSDSNSSVIAISGEWGVGKTYAWKQIVDSFEICGDNNFNKYSYVTLFGVNSVDELKFSIFSNVEGKGISGSSSNAIKWSHFNSFVDRSRKRISPFFKHIPSAKKYSSLVEAVAFVSVQDTLICIDDIERRGRNLDIKDILGLVSFLKEQRGCKVVLLLNLDDDNAEYNRYKEKVIDLELKFSPSAEQCSDIAYRGNSDTNKLLKKYSIYFDIKNIRVLNKILQYSDRLIRVIDGVSRSSIEYILYRVSFFTWCNLCHEVNSKLPSLTYIRNNNFDVINDNSNYTVEEKKWTATMINYEILCKDPLDKLLIEYILSGYFDEEKLLSEVDGYENRCKEKNRAELNNEAWNIYNNSFDDNEGIFVDTLVDSFMHGCNYLSLDQLNSAVRALDALGHNDKSKLIIDKYADENFVDKYISNYDFKRLSGISDQDYLGLEIKKAFELRKSRNVSAPLDDKLDFIKGLINKPALSDEDFDYMSRVSENEYYSMFKKLRGKELDEFVSFCQKVAKIDVNNNNHGVIESNIDRALREIASESNMNKFRVMRFGIIK